MKPADHDIWFEEDDDPPLAAGESDTQLRDAMKAHWDRLAAAPPAEFDPDEAESATQRASHLQLTPSLELLDRAGRQIDVMQIGKKRSGKDSWFESTQDRIVLRENTSARGNVWYDFVKSAIPLPAGLDTGLRVNGILIPMGQVYRSKRGNPTRRGSAEVLVGSTRYIVTAYLTETSSPYWIRVLAMSIPRQKRSGDDTETRRIRPHELGARHENRSARANRDQSIIGAAYVAPRIVQSELRSEEPTRASKRAGISWFWIAVLLLAAVNGFVVLLR